MPSCAAIAAAVVAWSPVIIRTRIPASLQQRDRVLRLLARRVDDARRARAASAPAPRRAATPPGRTRPGRCRARRRPARAGPRRRAGRSRPAPASRPSVGRDRAAVGAADRRRAREQHVGRALDEAADDAPSASRGRSPSACTRSRTAPRRRAGRRGRVSSTSMPPLAASTTSAASVGSPTISPSRTAASLASAIGSRNGSSGVSALARDAQDLAPRSSSPRPRPSSGGRRPRAAAPSSG